MENNNVNTYGLRFIFRHKITNSSTFFFMFPCYVKKIDLKCTGYSFTKECIADKTSAIDRSSPH